MKPRNELERNIVSLSEKLNPISKDEWSWAFKNSHKSYGVISRNKVHCFECNHKWSDPKQKNLTCPSCKSKLKIVDDTNHTEKRYTAYLTTSGEFQVVRILFTRKIMKRTQFPIHTKQEVIQYWINPKGIITTMACDLNHMSGYYSSDNWLGNSSLSIKTTDKYGYNKYSVFPHKIYTKKRILKTVKRNGFKGSFNRFSPQTLISLLLTSNYAETLFKTKQYDLLEQLNKTPDKINEYWPSIKIALRNNYLINQPSDWLDLLDLLKFFNKDLHNPKYVCPTNIDYTHNKYVSKKRKHQRKLKTKELIEDIESSEIEYKTEKSKYFNLEFTDDEITITVLKSVKEFLTEADILNHCLFTNEYYAKSNSLIFSARIKGIPIETTEFLLDRMEVNQSRGFGNKTTIYSKRITNVINKNIPSIRQILINQKAAS